MKTVWTRRALGELEDIQTYIAKDDPNAAARLIERIAALVETTLAEQPRIGRPGRVAGTRELVARPSYILVYRVNADQIDVLAVRHGAQLWPKGF